MADLEMLGWRDTGMLRYWATCSWIVPGVAGRFQGASGSFPGDLWEALGNVLGLSRQPLGSFLGCLEVSWDPLGGLLELLGSLLGRLQGLAGAFLVILEARRTILGALGAILEATWGVLGASWEVFESSWGYLERFFELEKHLESIPSDF